MLPRPPAKRLGDPEKAIGRARKENNGVLREQPTNYLHDHELRAHEKVHQEPPFGQRRTA